MKIALFYHSMYSDWNHGNAHFLRGMVQEMQKTGHKVIVFEPATGWSMQNLLKNQGNKPLEEFRRYFPDLYSTVYDLNTLDFQAELQDTDLVIVHEWNEPELISTLGQLKESLGYVLLFHDTHHRAVSAPGTLAQFDLTHYDGVLGFGEVIKDIYLRNGWVKKGWTWHEAADTNTFRPLDYPKIGDLVWIGNWGDEERSEELHEFLINPVKELKLKARVYGVRYPIEAIDALTQAGIEYCGWLPNFKVPEAFSQYKVTVHVPRRPYAEQLPGIPTIRMFEALACGIPLVSSPWKDTDNLFTVDHDYLMAHDKHEMKEKLSRILTDEEFARQLATNGLKTIRERHSCVHRLQQLEGICRELGLNPQIIELQQL